jgi:hypothetical protein
VRRDRLEVTSLETVAAHSAPPTRSEDISDYSNR